MKLTKFQCANRYSFQASSKPRHFESKNFFCGLALHPSVSDIIGYRMCHVLRTFTGADPGIFLGGGALVSCSTSTPINPLVFFFFFFDFVHLASEPSMNFSNSNLAYLK